MMAVWLVRAGKNGQRQNFALENNCVVIGWDNCPDLRQFETREALDAAYTALKPEKSQNFIRNHVGQLWAFARRIEQGDIVALPLKDQDAIAFGRVTGDYEYNEDNPQGAKHCRPVEWLTQDLPRDRLEQDLLYSLGAFLTVCQIKRNNAEVRIRSLLEGGTPPPAVTSDDEDPGTTDTVAPPDLDDYSDTQIRSYIAQNFAGHKLADLTEAILQAQGFQTEKSEPGPDGGVDIIAGKGVLGFDPPRLCVQVKATGTPQDIKVLRELKGVMKDFGADHGLFVSWSGFRRSILSEARKNFFDIRLWDASDVVQALQQNYDKLSDSLRAELPLKRIWTLVQEES